MIQIWFQIDELYAPDKSATLASLRSEVAALQVRCEGLQSQVRAYFVCFLGVLISLGMFI